MKNIVPRFLTQYKGLALLIIFTILQGCSTSHHSSTHRLLYNIEDAINDQYKVKRGYLIALYDLANIDKIKSIYSSHYAGAINDSKLNQLYIDKIKSHKRPEEQLKSMIKIKIHKIKNLLKALNSKYQFLSAGVLSAKELALLNEESSLSKIFKIFKADQKSTSYSSRQKIHNMLGELYELDKIMEKLPTFAPESPFKISSYYGMRKHPQNKKQKLHMGLDLITAKNGLIYSAASGKVVRISNDKKYGKMIDIAHGNNIMTRYTHLQYVLASEGNHVVRGQKIAVQGRTGNATGDHLHFEVRIKNKPINPLEFIAHACN